MPAVGIEAAGTMVMCLALAVVAPYLVHEMSLSPRSLLPMHFPVLLAGALLRPWQAAVVGLFAPAVCMGLTGMPTSDQTLRMMPELATYGLVTSVMLKLVPMVDVGTRQMGRIVAISLAMITAMICGRLVYVVISISQMGIQSLDYYLGILVAPAVVGLFLQLLLIPPIAVKLQKALNR